MEAMPKEDEVTKKVSRDSMSIMKITNSCAY
jgi:hypothetical protein